MTFIPKPKVREAFPRLEYYVLRYSSTRPSFKCRFRRLSAGFDLFFFSKGRFGCLSQPVWGSSVPICGS